MTRFSRVSILLNGLILAALFPEAAGAQSACRQLGVDCSHPVEDDCARFGRGCPQPSRGRSGGGGYNPTYRAPGPTREEKQAYSYNNRGVKAAKKSDWWAAYQNYKQAVALWPSERIYKRNFAYAANEIGRGAANKQDWDSAYGYFLEATTQWPNDPAYKKNLEIARWWLQVGYFQMAESIRIKQQEKAAAEQRAAEQRAGAAQVMRRALSNAIDSLDSSKAYSEKSSGSQSGELTFLGAGSSPAFGSTSNPSKTEPRSGPVESPITVKSALEQASSATKSGEDARTAVKSEEARTHSSYQFDDKPRRDPDAIPVPRSDTTPRTAELLTHIRGADQVMQSNKIVKQMVEWYQHLDALREEAEAKRTEFQMQIDSGKGDAATVAKKDALTSQIDQLTKDQQTVKDQIKENLAAGWNEETPQAPGTGSKP